MVDLTVIIVSYNTKELTLQCLDSLLHSFQSSSGEMQYEVVVVDNGSVDGTVEELREFGIKHQTSKVKLRVIEQKENLGFSKANNIGLKVAEGNYILFLNSDVVIDKVDFSELLEYVQKQPKFGALTVKVLLPTGEIDPASHRGFPTVWRSFCYFSKLELLLGRFRTLSSIFGGYHLLQFSLDQPHEIDSPSGAFFLSPRQLLLEIGGFDEDFFMYGEDIDLSYRIKQKGYRIIYYPTFTVTHLKGQSGIHNANQQTRKKISSHFYNAMKIFYKKHYERENNALITWLVYFFIDFKQKQNEKNRD